MSGKDGYSRNEGGYEEQDFKVPRVTRRSLKKGSAAGSANEGNGTSVGGGGTSNSSTPVYNLGPPQYGPVPSMSVVQAGGSTPTRSSHFAGMRDVSVPGTFTTTLSFNNQSNYQYQPQQQQHATGIGGGGGGINFSLAALPMTYNWSTMKDIRDADIRDVLNPNWNVPLTLQGMFPTSKSNAARSLLWETLNSHDWRTRGDLIFYCDGGRAVRVHSVLLAAILPKLVEDLIKFRSVALRQNDPWSFDTTIPVYLSGVDADVMGLFMELCCKGGISALGKQVAVMSSIVELLKINEATVYVNVPNLGSPALTGIMQTPPRNVSTVVASSMQSASVPTTSSGSGIISSTSDSIAKARTSPAPKVKAKSTKRTRGGNGAKESEGAKNQPAIRQYGASSSTPQQEDKGASPPSKVMKTGKKISIQEAIEEISRLSSRAKEDDYPEQPEDEERDDSDAEEISRPRVTRRRSGRLSGKSNEQVPVKEGKKRRSTTGKKSKENVEQINPNISDRATYSKEQKKTVLDCLNNGETVGDVAKRFNIPNQTLSRWKYMMNRKSTAAANATAAAAAPSGNDANADNVTAAEDGWSINLEDQNSIQDKNALLNEPTFNNAPQTGSGAPIPLPPPPSTPGNEDNKLIYGSQEHRSAMHMLRSQLLMGNPILQAQVGNTGTINPEEDAAASVPEPMITPNMDLGLPPGAAEVGCNVDVFSEEEG